MSDGDNDAYLRGRIDLKLPQHQKLSIAGFGNTDISLICSELCDFRLIHITSLDTFQGMPEGIERMTLTYVMTNEDYPSSLIFPDECTFLRSLSAMVTKPISFVCIYQFSQSASTL